MQQGPDSELVVDCTDAIVLECRCGGRLTLIGQEEDWYKEGRTAFECPECRARLTLASQSNETEGPALIGGNGVADASVRDLIRRIRTAQGR